MFIDGRREKIETKQINNKFGGSLFSSTLTIKDIISIDEESANEQQAKKINTNCQTLYDLTAHVIDRTGIFIEVLLFY